MGEHEGTRAGDRPAAKRARTIARGAAGGGAAPADASGRTRAGGAPTRGRDSGSLAVAAAKGADDGRAAGAATKERGAGRAAGAATKERGAGRAAGAAAKERGAERAAGAAAKGRGAERADGAAAKERGAEREDEEAAKGRGGGRAGAATASAVGAGGVGGAAAGRSSARGGGAAAKGHAGSAGSRASDKAAREHAARGGATNARESAGGRRWPADDEWCGLLVAARRRLRVSREALAEASGVSAATVRAYETGRRRPRREHLEQLLFHLNIAFDETNAILEAAGFAPRRSRFTPETHPHYYYTQSELQQVIDAAPWPEFVMNDSTEVIATNAAVDALWGIDFAHERRTRTQVQRNILSVASEHRFAERVLNWEECVAAMATVLKARPQSLDEPNPYFDAVLAEFARGDPAYLARLAEVWAKTPPHDSRVVWHYRVVWRDDEYGEMRFLATVAPASEPDGTGFNSWHPVDADSWSVLESVKARREGMAPARRVSRRAAGRSHRRRG